MTNKTATELWNNYRKLTPTVPETYEAWAFGDSKEMANELANLVVNGIKTATASNYILYELENEPLPHVGLYNIILNGEGKAVAIVKTTSVEIIPFDEVTEEHAFLEGEGDRSLSYWRDVHESFFSKELASLHLTFHNKLPVVCEKFEVVFLSSTTI